MNDAVIGNQTNTYLVAPMAQLVDPLSAFHRKGIQALAAVTVYGALIAGTGGVFSGTNATEFPHWAAWPMVELRPTARVRGNTGIKIQSIAAQILEFRDSLGLKMSEVAQIFGVSRQAAYSWLSGTAAPKPEIARRIWSLSRSASELKSGFAGEMAQFVHRPVLQDGRSLLDVLLSGGNLDNVIAELRGTAEKEALVRSTASSRNSGAFNEGNSSFVELVKPILEEHRG
ncbi:MAG: helix-turn-helix transcriptional regulator [Terracidiphilus sp.]